MKIKVIILAIISVVSITACSSNAGNDSNDTAKKIAELEKKVESLESENKQLKEASKSGDVSLANNEKQGPPVNDPVEKMKELTKGKVQVINDFAEITVNKTKFSKKIEPSAPTSIYTYYEAKGEDTTYLAIYTKIKNLGTSGKIADEFANVTIKYDNKFEYNTFSVLEENGGGNFTYTNITNIDPLSSNVVLYLAEVPKEVATGTEPIAAEFKINGDTFVYKIR